MTPNQVPDWAVEKYRYIETEESYWTEDVIACFIEEAKTKYLLDIDLETVCYSVAHCQGDYCKFDADVVKKYDIITTSDGSRRMVCLPDAGWPGFFRKHGDPGEFRLSNLMFDNEADFEIEQTSSDYPQFSFWFRDGLDLIFDEDEPFVELSLPQWEEDFEKEQKYLEEVLQDTMRDVFYDLHQRLYDEQDYLTSDEYVREYLANNLHIWEDDEENYLEEAA